MGLLDSDSIINGERELRFGQRVIEVDLDFTRGVRVHRRNLLVSGKLGHEDFVVGSAGSCLGQTRDEEHEEGC